METERDLAVAGAMRTLDRQNLHFVNKTRSKPALGEWRGQFTPGSVGWDLREAVGHIFSVQGS